MSLSHALRVATLQGSWQYDDDWPTVDVRAAPAVTVRHQFDPDKWYNCRPDAC